MREPSVTDSEIYFQVTGPIAWQPAEGQPLPCPDTRWGWGHPRRMGDPGYLW